MRAQPSAGEDRATPGQADLRLPMDGEVAKLPLPPSLPPPGTDPSVADELQAAWRAHMVNGFRQNERMFQETLQAYMKPYRLTVWLYASLFAVGLGLFVVAAVLGLRGGEPVAAVAFGGLSVAGFASLFLRHPLRALEENLECITWLGVAFNTYWTRLMYMRDPATVQEELKSAESDFQASVEKLIAQHAGLREQRPTGE
jgi:hypothetical protein